MCAKDRQRSRREPGDVGGKAREGWRAGRRVNQLQVSDGGTGAVSGATVFNYRRIPLAEWSARVTVVFRGRAKRSGRARFHLEAPGSKRSCLGPQLTAAHAGPFQSLERIDHSLHKRQLTYGESKDLFRQKAGRLAQQPRPLSLHFEITDPG